MFSKEITNSSEFLMMSQSAQNLYFHFGMNADDDGFCEVFTIMRMTDSKPDDLKSLHEKGFIYVIDGKICVVKDWHENNQLRMDRYKKSKYLSDPKIQEIYLTIMEDKIRNIDVYKPMLNPEPERQPVGNQPAPQERIGKVRIGKEREAYSSAEFLRMVPKEILEAFSQEYGISPKGIQSKATDLNLWRESKGKVYKNYKSFLENAIRKDQVQLRSQFPLRVAPQVSQSVKEASEMTPEQIERNRERLAVMGAEIAQTFRGA